MRISSTHRLGISMTAPYLARMIPRMTENLTELIELWSLCSERLRSGSSHTTAFNAMDDIRLASIDVISSITFGSSFNSIRAAVELLETEPEADSSTRPPTSALSHALEEILDIIGNNMLFPLPAWLTWWTRTFDTNWNRARKLLYDFLEERLDGARMAYEASGSRYDDPDARTADNVLDMIGQCWT